MARHRVRGGGGKGLKSGGGWFRKTLQIILCGIVLWPYSLSLSAQGATFTLVNRTSLYLHAIINNQPTVYIPPGGVVNYDAGGVGNVIVDVRYSPGQGKKGSAFRTFEIIYTTTSTGGGNTSATCTQESNDCQSSTEATTSVTATPVRWEVTPADMTAK